MLKHIPKSFFLPETKTLRNRVKNDFISVLFKLIVVLVKIENSIA